VREEFVRDFVFPMFRANALYEGLYLLGTSIARPLISKHLVEIAHAARRRCRRPWRHRQGQRSGAVRTVGLCAGPLDQGDRAVAGMGSDQPHQADRIRRGNQIPIAKDKRGEAPFSVDANLLHTSSEGKALENPAEEAPDYVYQRTVNPEDAPDTPEYIEVTFEQGDAVAINGVALSPATILTDAERIWPQAWHRPAGFRRKPLCRHEVARHLRNPRRHHPAGGPSRHRADHAGRGAGHLKDSIMPRYAELIYNGFWFSPEREMLQALIDRAQEHVTGTVRLKLYKGSVQTVGRWSDHSLYSEKHVTFEDDAGAYDQKDAAGFIRLNALRDREHIAHIVMHHS
jgi:argininosuccinate synthase